MEEGLVLALNWTQLPILVESDCAEAIKLIKERDVNLSRYAMMVSSIFDMFRERDIAVRKINREANGVSHELARFWLRDFPPEIAEAMNSDCIHPNV